MLATQSNWNCTGPNSNSAIVQVWERHQFSLCSPLCPASETKHPSSSSLACPNELIAVKQPEFHTGLSKPLSGVWHWLCSPHLQKQRAKRGYIRQLENDPASERDLTSCRYLTVTFIHQDWHRLDLNQAIWGFVATLLAPKAQSLKRFKHLNNISCLKPKYLWRAGPQD